MFADIDSVPTLSICSWDTFCTLTSAASRSSLHERTKPTPSSKASEKHLIPMYLATLTFLQFLLIFQVFLQKVKGFSLPCNISYLLQPETPTARTIFQYTSNPNTHSLNKQDSLLRVGHQVFSPIFTCWLDVTTSPEESLLMLYPRFRVANGLSPSNRAAKDCKRLFPTSNLSFTAFLYAASKPSIVWDS